MFVAEPNGGIDRGMCKPTARVGFESHAVLFQSVNAAQTFKSGHVRFTTGIEGIKEAVPALERLRV